MPLHRARPPPPALDDYIIGKYGGKYGIWEHTTKGRLVTTKTGLVEAIQWAHDQLPEGGSIGIKAGKYAKAWETKLTLSTKGITLHGADTWATWLQQKDGVNLDPMIEITEWGITIRNLTIDGNKANNPTGGEAIKTLEDSFLEDIYIWYMKGDGLYAYGGGGFFKRVYVEYCDGNGIYAAGTRNTFIQSAGVGCAGRGLVASSAAAENNYVGCIFSSNSSDGVLLDRSRREKFLGGEVRDNVKNGFLLAGAQRCVFNSVIIRDNSKKENNVYDGVRIQTYLGVNSLRNILTHLQILSTIANKHRYGIREEDVNQDYNIVSNCIVTDAVTGQISLQGLNSIDDNNITA